MGQETHTQTNRAWRNRQEVHNENNKFPKARSRKLNMGNVVYLKNGGDRG